MKKNQSTKTTKSKSSEKALKTTKKVSKPVVASHPQVDKTMELNEASVSSSKSTKSKFLNAKTFAIIVIIGAVGYLGYMYKGEFVVALVDKKPVTRVELVKGLEKKYAKEELDALIIKKLIVAEGKNMNVMVSDDEVKAEIAKIKSSLQTQGISYTEALESQGMTEKDLIDEISLQRLAQKLVESKVNVTDAQIASFIETNSTYFPEGTSDAEKAFQAKEQLVQSACSVEIPKLIEELKTKANISYLKKY